MRTMTSAEWRAAVKADPAPRKPRPMTSKDYRAITGATEVLEPRAAKPGEIRALTLRVQVISEANARDHWTKVSKRKQRQKAALREAWLEAEFPVLAKPARVTFTRKGPYEPTDTDNLAGAFKGLRDQLAKLCGCDDGPGGPRWIYEQVTTKEAGVRILVVWP